MERKSDKTARPNKAESREDRLKAALKANMARRKAQARARAGSDKGKTGEKGS
ncbi:MAG: hypothetical protein AAFQ47_16530 [Pseudomonadota bacterium]